jgi:hypothetical protein
MSGFLRWFPGVGFVVVPDDFFNLAGGVGRGYFPFTAAVAGSIPVRSL